MYNRAGIVIGPSHQEGGAHFLDPATGRHMEEEGMEVNLPRELLQDDHRYSFYGTNAQVLNEILKLTGHSLADKVTMVKSGDIIICKRSAWDDEKRTYKGTLAEILNEINTSGGCNPINTDNETIRNYERQPAVHSEFRNHSVSVSKNGGRAPYNSKFRKKDFEAENPNSARWQKKKEHLLQLANVIHKLRSKSSRDLNDYLEGKPGAERCGLLALVISIMDRTGERVGNNKSAASGHFGVTGFEKDHISVVGSKVHLDYIGKKGVAHKTSFSDARIAKAIKKAMRNAPKTIDGKKNDCIFISSDGICINDDKANNYLQEFGITTKVLRGYFSNSLLIKKLSALPIDAHMKKRKKVFNKAAKTTAILTGHTPATMKKHYMVPELPLEYINHGRIIDLKNSGYYAGGGIAGTGNNSNFVTTNRMKSKEKKIQTEAWELVDKLSRQNAKSENTIGDVMAELYLMKENNPNNAVILKAIEDYERQVEHFGKYYSKEKKEQGGNAGEPAAEPQPSTINHQSSDCGCFHSYLKENHPELCARLVEENINEVPELREQMDEAHEQFGKGGKAKMISPKEALQNRVRNMSRLVKHYEDILQKFQKKKTNTIDGTFYSPNELRSMERAIPQYKEEITEAEKELETIQ